MSDKLNKTNILYKYVDTESAKKIIESNSVAFSYPDSFNDPFELSSSYFHAKPEFMHVSRGIAKGLNKIRSMTYGILCLTKSNNNPLMWAHYSDAHEGMVLGIRVNFDDFTDPNRNVIPVQYGNVIYSQTKPNHPYYSWPQGKSSTQLEKFDHSLLERLQREFLYKPLCWAYEEEVRVVKALSLQPKTGQIRLGRNKFNIVENIKGKKIVLYKLPEDCIKQVYLGLRSEFKEKSKEELLRSLGMVGKNVDFFQCVQSDSTYEIHVEEIR